MNKELLNSCYNFINRYITVDMLILQLENINKDGLTKKDIEETKKLIDGIKNISNNIPNKVDELIINRKKKVKDLIIKLDKLPLEDKNNIFVNNLEKEYSKVEDSYDRWYKVFEYISENDYFNECFDSLSKYELLEFITRKICVPFPPTLNQLEFEELVNEGIKRDERELLWRLAFNYEKSNINFDSIMDYFIKVKDGYYIQELICVVGDKLNIDNMIDKINDLELIEDLIKRKDVIGFRISDDKFNKLIAKLNKK